MSYLSLEEALRYVGREDLVKEASNSEDYLFNTKNATFISYVKAHLKSASDMVKTNCDQYAKFWQIKEDCEGAAQKIASYEPEALRPEDFALFDKTAGVRAYAAYDKDSTWEAACAFTQDRENLPLEMRQKTAAALLSRAEKHGTHLPEYVETYLHKAAGLGFASPDSVETILVERLNASNVSDEVTEKLAEALSAMLDDEALCTDIDHVKTAMAVVEDYDVYAGLTDKYGNGVSLPEQIIDDRYTASKLAGVQKLAACSVQLINGTTVSVDTLTKEALAAVDPSLADFDTSELIEVLPTLPKGDADLLSRLA